jgi:multisubunit Na+/H+ antiporter MnhB subunit
MSRRVALPLLASGLALLALAATILPFEAEAISQAGRPAWDRLLAFRPVLGATALLAAAAGFALWRMPRKPITPILLALALGALGGTATLVALPEVLGDPSTRFALTTH